MVYRLLLVFLEFGLLAKSTCDASGIFEVSRIIILLLEVLEFKPFEMMYGVYFEVV